MSEDYKVAGYSFTSPISVLDAKAPKGKAGVYILLVQSKPGVRGKIRYVGQTSDLQHRINFGHKMIKKLYDEADKDLDRIRVVWKEIESKNKRFEVEQKLILHFKKTIVNIEEKSK